MYKNYRTKGATQSLTHEEMGAVEDAILKVAQKVVVGIVPRERRSPSSFNKYIDNNCTLRDLCLRDRATYDHFFGRSKIFQIDGVYLNVKAKAELTRMVEEACSRARLPGHRRGDTR